MSLEAHERFPVIGPTLMRVSKGEEMYARLMRFLSNEKGASLVEYSLLVLLIAIVALAAVAYFGR